MEICSFLTEDFKNLSKHSVNISCFLHKLSKILTILIYFLLCVCVNLCAYVHACVCRSVCVYVCYVHVYPSVCADTFVSACMYGGDRIMPRSFCLEHYLTF